MSRRVLSGPEAAAGRQRAGLFLPQILVYFPDIPELGAIADGAPNCAHWAREMGARPSIGATEPEMKPPLAA